MAGESAYGSIDGTKNDQHHFARFIARAIIGWHKMERGVALIKLREQEERQSAHRLGDDLPLSSSLRA